ncbi:MAG TPA: metalloregulator ArsR/SmtB family transcription factor [Steroidobacteraceae bacterium]|nr:metalloregulator ArsR/SmtB family transcription factor [Steroidobacteraceae bacterium]
MSTPVSFDQLLQRLRAAAEPTRFRILVACAGGELTVGELCALLEQSQPRVSRHLRLLCDAGLLVRFREEHRVYYRVPMRGVGAEAARELLAGLDPRDPFVERDRMRAAKVREQRAAEAAAQLPLRAGAEGQVASLQAALLQELGDEPIGELLDIGTGTGRILSWLAPRATQATGIDLESEALRVARTTVHTAGLSHCVLRRGDMYALPYAAATFDTIAMDRVLAEAERPRDVLAQAARLLRPGGRLIVIEDFDRLETGDAHNPLTTLRQWLGHAGITCERLRPIDAANHHLLLALGRRRESIGAAA